MSLDEVDWRLLKSLPIEEISVARKEGDTRRDFDRPLIPCLRNSQLWPDRPSVVAEIEQFRVVILANGGRYLQARADDEVLLVVLELRRG